MLAYTIIITTHARANLLGRAIGSVKAQDVGPVQVIVVSDCPCHDTHAVASRLLGPGDLFLQRKGLPGPAESRNVALSLAEGDHVIFLDDDDALSPTYLRDVGAHIGAGDLAFTDFSVVLERQSDAGIVQLSHERRSLAERNVEDMYLKNFIPLSCLLFPRAALERRRYDTSLVLIEDWEFILNVIDDYPLRHVPVDGPIIYSREIADNRGNRNNHLLEATYRTIYRQRPAPTPALKVARQTFFASLGLAAYVEAV